MSINLTANNFLVTGAISYTFRYARVDNVTTPVYTTVNGITNDPATIATDLPDGQYVMEGVPIFADGRVCPWYPVYTDACPGLLAINAIIQGSNLIVSYTAPSTATHVRIVVTYPNGGTSIGEYVNNGNDIPIPIPAGLYGDFSVYGQSVCDTTSGFYSAPSSIVTVSRLLNNVEVVSEATSTTVNSISNITGFALSAPLVAGGDQSGTHVAFSGAITANYTKAATNAQYAALYINNTQVACVALASVVGTDTLTFPAFAVGTADSVFITFQDGTC